MKKSYLMTVTLGLGLFVSSAAFGTCQEVVYQTDFSNNKGWQTNNAENYYLDSLVGNPAPAYYQREITPSGCPPDGEYAYHLLPSLTQNVKWCLEYDIFPVSIDWAGNARLSFTDEDMTVGNMCGISPTYLTLNYGHDDSGYRVVLDWVDSQGNAGGVFFSTGYYTLGTWYENLVEWDPKTSQFKVLIKEQGGVTLVDRIVTSSDPDLQGNWPKEFRNIDRLAMSTLDPYALGAIGISYIDNVVVGQIPEPATIGLLGLGALGLLRKRRK